MITTSMKRSKTIYTNNYWREITRKFTTSRNWSRTKYMTRKPCKTYRNRVNYYIRENWRTKVWKMILWITINSSPSTSTITIKVWRIWNVKSNSSLKQRTLTLASNLTSGPRSPSTRKWLGIKTGENSLFSKKTTTLRWNIRRKLVRASKRNGSEKSGRSALTITLRRN